MNQNLESRARKYSRRGFLGLLGGAGIIAADELIGNSTISKVWDYFLSKTNQSSDEEAPIPDSSEIPEQTIAPKVTPPLEEIATQDALEEGSPGPIASTTPESTATSEPSVSYPIITSDQIEEGKYQTPTLPVNSLEDLTGPVDYMHILKDRLENPSAMFKVESGKQITFPVDGTLTFLRTSQSEGGIYGKGILAIQISNSEGTYEMVIAGGIEAEKIVEGYKDGKRGDPLATVNGYFNLDGATDDILETRNQIKGYNVLIIFSNGLIDPTIMENWAGSQGPALYQK